MKNLIFYQFGEIPDYLLDNIEYTKNLHKGKVKIYLLTNQTISIEGIETVDISKYKSYDIKNPSENNDQFWIYTIQRFYHIRDFIAQSKIKTAFHIENDVLLLKTLDYIHTYFADGAKRLMYPVDNLFRGIASILFIPNVEELNHFLEFINNFPQAANDMNLLGLYKRRQTFPVIPHYQSKGIFDAAAIGQYLYGTHKNPGVQFENETAIIKLKEHNIEFKNKGIYIDDIPVVNIHVHSKNLKDAIKSLE